MLLISFLGLKGQMADSLVEGTVSYITSQHVYVKFLSTKGIAPGDSLYILKDGRIVPALKVNNLSSMSCVCEPLNGIDFKLNDKVFFRTKPKEKQPAEEQIETQNIAIEISAPDTGLKELDSVVDENPEQDIYGKISVSSYSNFTNTPSGHSQRLRYTFSMNAKNISDSKFSGETYISFAHRGKEWNEVQDNIFNALKIYSLALRYDFNPTTTVWLGRKISREVPVLGAVDGLQVRKKIKDFSVGLIAGLRPDYQDYGFNKKLLQFGAYGAHEYNGEKGYAQTSMAAVQQQNSGNTDRRFVYFQHINTLFDKVYFYGSAEIDLFQNVNGSKNSDPRLTGIYLSFRYRPVRKLSITASYSSRKNVIYYETYSSIVDRLLDIEALQGYRFGITWRPANRLAVGIKGSYRKRKDDPRSSKNLYGFLTITQVPQLKVSATASATLMETAWLNGKIYGLRLNRDILPGKIYGGAGYRYVDYSFTNSEAILKQHLGEMNLTWRILDKLYFSVNYEGTFETDNIYNRIYANLTQRF